MKTERTLIKSKNIVAFDLSVSERKLCTAILYTIIHNIKDEVRMVQCCVHCTGFYADPSSIWVLIFDLLEVVGPSYKRW